MARKSKARVARPLLYLITDALVDVGWTVTTEVHSTFSKEFGNVPGRQAYVALKCRDKTVSLFPYGNGSVHAHMPGALWVLDSAAAALAALVPENLS